jgi:MFS family permease
MASLRSRSCAFYALFVGVSDQDRWIIAAFFVWVSTFNVLIISVFWTFMADIFSRTQAKRLFGFVAAGGTIGSIVGPAIATLLAKRLGNNNLMLISAAGFVAPRCWCACWRTKSSACWRPASKPSAPASIIVCGAIRSMASCCCCDRAICCCWRCSCC